MEYDSLGRQTLTRDALGHEMRYTYDALGRLIQTTYADGTTTSTEYDNLGRRISQTDALGRTTQYEYDDAGRMTAVVLPEVTDPLTGELTHPRYEYGYDDQGQQTRITDPNGHTTRFTYDHLGRQITRTLPLGTLTGIESSHYDDRTLAQLNASGDDVTASTALGQTAYMVDFEGNVTGYLYDNSALGSGRTTQVNYYSADDLTTAGITIAVGMSPAMIKAALAGITAARTVSYTYDDEGRMLQTNDTAHGITTNTYNDEDQLVRIASPEGIINYAYDDLGQLVRTWTGDTASSLNGGTPTTENVYTYDTLGRLATVTQTWRQAIDIADETTSYTYDLNGNLDMQVTEWNNVASDYDYDTMNRLTHLTHFVDSDGDRILDDMSEQTLAKFDYSYLADGTRSQAVETDDLGDVTTITWEYDALNRLVSETSESTNDDRDYTDQFTYDLSSNRLTQTHTTLSDVVTTVYFYDANDRLFAEVKDSTADNAQDRYTEYAYDNTNQTGKTVYEGTDNTGDVVSSVTYTYDESGRMVMVETDSDGDGSVNSTVTYTYDTNSHRVTETTNDGTTTTTRSFLFDPQNATGYGKQIEEHVDGQLSKTFIIGHMLIAQHDATNGLLNFIQDGHGNTRALINTAAAIVQRFAFDAYGKTLTAENYTLADNAFTMWLNPDGAYSIATGLTNHIARWRDGARFMSLDSYAGNTSEPISLHKYLYAHGNPVMGVDPRGNFTVLSQLAANSIRNLIAAAYQGAAFGVRITTDVVLSGATLTQVLSEYAFDWALGPVEDLITILTVPAVAVESVFRYLTGEGEIASDQYYAVSGLLVLERFKSKAATGIANYVENNHLNQRAAFSKYGIGKHNGVRLKLEGSTQQPGSEHYRFHQVLDGFFDQYRPGGRFDGRKPRTGEYNRALYEALKHAGLSSVEVKSALLHAVREQRKLKINNLSEIDIPKGFNIPRIQHVTPLMKRLGRR